MTFPLDEPRRPDSRACRPGSIIALVCLLAACGETPSGTEDHPLPALTALSPTVVEVGQASADVTLSGTGFVEGSRARIDGTDRATTFVSPQELTMTLTDADLATGGTYQVVVVNGPPGGGTSGELTLTVGYPQPTVTSVSPLAAPVGSPAITLTIQGTGFVDGASVVRFGTSSLGPATVTATEITVDVGANLLTSAAFVDVTVVNPSPAGGGSDATQFEIEHPVPVLTSASPTTVIGGVDTRISVVGEHFVSSSELMWNGVAYPSQIVSESILYADLPAAAFSSAGAGSIEVRTPPPGGGTSAPIPATVVDPPPRVTGFAPASATAGSGAFTLTVQGVNFSASSEVRWNGAPRTTTYVSVTAVEVEVSAGDVSAAGSGMIVVREPNGAESHAVGFPILPAAPSVADSVTVALTTVDLVADPDRGVVYAAVPASAPAYPNEVVALDPGTGAVVWHTTAGSDPRRLVLSDDGAYLYVALWGAASVSRIDVASEAKDLDIPLPAAGFRVEDLLVLPGSPTSIAVSLRNTCCSPRHEGVVVFDGAVQRPLATQDHTGSNRIEASSHGERIYGYNNETTEFGFRRILVRSDGVMQDGVYGGVVTGFGTDIIYDGGLVFTTRGGVIEPESRTVLGTFTGPGVMRPDVANGRVHFFDGGTLSAHHYATFTSLGSISVPTAAGATLLIRFGTDGMAFGGHDAVTFVRSGLIGS
jgi:hypothetical protein